MQVQEKGFSLTYVGQARPRFWSLFLCASVVGSGSLFTPDAKGYREFPIQVHPYYIARSPEKGMKKGKGSTCRDTISAWL